MDIASIRKDYALKSLKINDVKDDPLMQFKQWFDEAISAAVVEVNAMNLSTMGVDGFPNGRIVLLKGVDTGFVFFTNYSSEKGKELQKLGKAALTFFWPELERQVRIQGTIEKVSAKESDDYFFSRPVGSQIGAWTSPQSQKIESHQDLIDRKLEKEAEFESQAMRRPAHWGGYRLLPCKMEFWQGRPSRLHDRVSYIKTSDKWEKYILAP